jgi:hypothetical protein
MEDACGKANRTIFTFAFDVFQPARRFSKQLTILFCHAYSQTMDPQAQTIKRYKALVELNGTG